MQVKIQLKSPILDKSAPQTNKNTLNLTISATIDQNTMIEPSLLPDNKNGQPKKKKCYVCYQLKPQSSVHLFCCTKHQFCKSCIAKLININLHNFKIIKCPEFDCSYQMNEKSPYYSLLSKDQQLKLQKIRRNRDTIINPRIKICKKIYCDGTLSITPQKAECMHCKERHCLKCQQIQHLDMCDTDASAQLMKLFGYKRCPNCTIMAQFNGHECYRIECLCGCEFCYQCGNVWKNQPDGHYCRIKGAAHPIRKIREQVKKEADRIEFQGYHNFLYKIEPRVERGPILNFLYLCFFILFVYPFLCLFAILTFCLIVLAQICGFILLYILVAIFLPILPTDFGQSMLLAKCLKQMRVPKCVIIIFQIMVWPISIFVMMFFMYWIGECSEGIRRISKSMKSFAKKAYIKASVFVYLPCVLCGRKEEPQRQ